MTYITLASCFALYIEGYFMCKHHFSEYESVWSEVWPQNKCRSQWPIFNSPVILSFILKVISYIKTILSGDPSVLPQLWPRNEWRSQWPIFPSLVILPCILKNIWGINIILLDFEPVGPKDWLQNRCRSQWLKFFMVQWFCLVPRKVFYV